MKIKQHMAALLTATALASSLPTLAEERPHLTPETMLTLARVGSAALSPDGKLVVYSVGFPNIKDNKIRTEFFTVTSYPDHTRHPWPIVSSVDTRWTTHQLPL